MMTLNIMAVLALAPIMAMALASGSILGADAFGRKVRGISNIPRRF